jgi:ethanolamine ammonia-lyase small subunit
VLLGERPGLATAESMSAYIAYNAYVGMPEAKRTVVSNIHRNGTAAVEAGAYIAEVIEKVLAQKASGVDLVK